MFKIRPLNVELLPKIKKKTSQMLKLKFSLLQVTNRI